MNLFSELEFVSADATGVKSMWSVQPTGDYARDNTTGRRYALQVVDYIRVNNNPALLPAIMRDMIKAGQHEATEVGFLFMIGCLIATTAPMALEV